MHLDHAFVLDQTLTSFGRNKEYLGASAQS